jgi:hypothetical protein
MTWHSKPRGRERKALVRAAHDGKCKNDDRDGRRTGRHPVCHGNEHIDGVYNVDAFGDGPDGTKIEIATGFLPRKLAQNFADRLLEDAHKLVMEDLGMPEQNRSGA